MRRYLALALGLLAVLGRCAPALAQVAPLTSSVSSLAGGSSGGGGVAGGAANRFTLWSGATTVTKSDALAYTLGDDSNPLLTLTSPFAGKPGMQITGATSQSANLLTISSGGNDILEVAAGGRLTLRHDGGEPLAIINVGTGDTFGMLANGTPYSNPAGALDIGPNGNEFGWGRFVTGVRIVTPRSPAATDTCSAGEIAWSTTHVYVCTDTDTWKRAALTGGY